ncbi:Cyclopropane-fatty-acyl-phospholipid synthase family protein [Heracleum sosnowskyi]|uniref:Cyclopropane-fatty-acyl-phospholipid synthase family protein n=1 Tax=Heracleum sosnowskyi TaxID=360622 RepID=A0AAD8HAJ7_9APIA|nr:Cyclopropane-fatty-acyl-phospholipid synthase family protein [Heracleum sosnowskyi]
MQQMRIAVIGAGISGLVSAYVLAKAGVDVVLYEKEASLGGHAKTVTVDDGVDLDLGFMVFNRVTYPNMMEFFERLGVDMEVSDMSLSVSLDNGRGCEWGSRGGLSSLFSQKRNALNPYFWQMIREIFKFKIDVIRYVEDLENNADIERNETLGQFISSHGYSDLFQKAYLIPMCSSIWSSPSEGVMNFSAYAILSFCRNHHLLQLFGRPQWLTVRCRSHSYVNKVKEELIIRGCQILSGCPVQSVTAVDGGCDVICEDGSQTRYDGCIMAVHAPDALKILGQATHDETRVLGAFQYEYSDIYLHRDTNLMPKNPAAWSSWNFLGDVNNKVCLTHWLNVLQNISQKGLPYLVTLNPSVVPDHTLLKWTTGHPVPNVAATKASLELDSIQGKRGIWFCGAYQGYGFHEDGLKAGMVAANGVIGKNSTLLKNPKHMVLSKFESGARLYATRRSSKSLYDFYRQQRFENFVSRVKNQRGWWTPMFLTAGIASAKYYFHHVLRQNTLTQARRNISRHYDLSNELFALFLDETMTYSCANFKMEGEDLKTAQQRKNSILIDKARVKKDHEVLEIGFGWGSLAIEIVKRTGCKYTGITLSVEQLRYAEMKVKEAGLQNNIKFLLCDYRQLQEPNKFDRILSCEMLESVGHEYMEEFFGCCESSLAEDGILVLQFTSIPDAQYDHHRRISGFMKEYIFPGACLPSLSRVTSAMAASSRLCVEHVENMGIHYYQTLRCWRTNFLEKQSKILSLGFDQKFICTWEYYFDYCAAGFKTRALANYQVVFSRPGNVDALGNPYIAIPSAEH